MSKELKRGYTTGVHASFAFKSALEAFCITKEKSITITQKMDNDDLDITKGCEIVVTISDRLNDLELNPISHKPYIIGSIEIYAGVGVGVVTKNGLKPPKGYPAINPTPLNAIKDISNKFNITQENIYVTISVTDGANIAKQTANAKVGVLGGISILGTTGFVKPISSLAYIDSIRTELNFIKSNGYQEVILTLGNSSFIYAKENYNKEQIIEIGNFVYDSFEMSKELGVTKAIWICGIGKATKVMQGFKNTHNRFGSIDFESLRDDIKNSLGVEVNIESTRTVKGVSMQLKRIDRLDEFYKKIEIKARNQIKKWFPTLNIDIRILK